MIKYLAFVFLLIPSSLTDIGKKNAAIKSAARSYAEADYEASVEKHLELKSEFNVDSPHATFNLALSYHYNGNLEEAQRTYSSLISSPNKEIASFASNQNGTILANEKKFEEALAAFKYALIKNPENEIARYNYELLARWLEENPDQQQQDQDDQGEDSENQDQQDQQDQDQQSDSQENKDGEGEEQTDEDEASESQKKDDKEGEKSQDESDSQEPSDMESDLSEREKQMERMREQLEEMNLTPEQAAQILEAMNAAELRYIQQNRKKPTKRPERGLPEW
jgi:hypothetical protein